MSEQSLLNELDLALIMVNAEMRVYTVNEATEKLFNSGRRHLCQRTITALLPANVEFTS